MWLASYNYILFSGIEIITLRNFGNRISFGLTKVRYAPPVFFNTHLFLSYFYIYIIIFGPEEDSVKIEENTYIYSKYY